MRPVLRLALPVLLLAGSTDVRGWGEAMSGSASGASLELRAKKAEVPQGDPAELTVVLRNTGDRPLWVNKRLLVNSPFVPEPYREVWMAVTGPDGQERRFECKIKVGRPEPKDYVALAPGQELERTVDMAKCHDLKALGAYRASATYADGNKEPPAAPDGAAPLREPVKSGEVELRVVPKHD